MENFGIWTDISQACNKALGDTSGRTVSRRTANGLQNVTGWGCTDREAEIVVHIGMIVGLILLFCSRYHKGFLVITLILLGLLFILYHAGKEKHQVIHNAS